MSCDLYISVIICTYNRSSSLKIVLDGILTQQEVDSLGYEVIVVDNNSSDDTAAVIDFYEKKFGGKLRHFFEGQGGITAARNRGITEAHGNFLAFTDDDVRVDSRWLFNIAKVCRETEADAIGGRFLADYPENTPRWIIDNADILNGPIVLYDYGEQLYPYKDFMLPFIGANMIIKKAALADCGAFRVDLGLGSVSGSGGEDTEIFRRLVRNNKRIYYSGEILVWHPVTPNRMTLRYMAKWSIRHGKYFVVIERKKNQEDLIFCFGVPRYIFRILLEEGASLIFSCFNRREFLKHWCRFFCHVGMIKAYRDALHIKPF